MFQSVKLTKTIPPKYSFLFLIFIFVLGLAGILWLHYIFNIQYKPIKSFLAGPLTTAPKTLRLTLSEPDDESLTFKNQILISGNTSPYKDVLIFTTSQNQIIKSKVDGSFSTLLDLKFGVNKITVVVFDINGDTKETERIVYYSEEKL